MKQHDCISDADGERERLFPKGYSEKHFPIEGLPEPEPCAVVRIRVDDCPKPNPENCVEIDGANVTSRCKFMGDYPENVEGTLVLGSLRCTHPDNSSDRKEVSFLRVHDCPRKRSCIDKKVPPCEDLKYISKPEDNSPPHFRVECTKE
ncbi:MAG: hypothetical protein SWH78_17660 [Thermodesulfobacteriota bacterium]|nr:hypothetical protein [Thermodesulfobacteriota bacterium]